MSDNKKYYYLKLKEDFFDSEAVVLLESMPDGVLYSNVLLKLYLRSLKNNGKLMFNDRIPYNPIMIASVTRMNVGIIEKALNVFEQLGLIEVLDNGAIYITDIQNFIGESSTEADRIRSYRNRIATEKNLLKGGNKNEGCTNVITNVQEMSDKSTPENRDKSLDIRDKSIKRESKKADESSNESSTTRHQYGPYKNVLLSDEDLEKLKREFPKDLESRIERLSEYMASTGKRYKNHLATIRSWARTDKEKQNDKNSAFCGSRERLTDLDDLF